MALGGSRHMLGGLVVLAAGVFAQTAVGQGLSFETDPVVSCLVLPWETVALAASTDGIVAEILVDRGDAVEEGQLVVRLNDSVQRAYLATVQARAENTTVVEQADIRLAIAQSTLERNRVLFERQQITGDEWDRIRGTYEISVVELEAAREELRQAELEVRRAEVALEQTRVYAPSDAVVLQRLVSVGERTSPEPLLELAVIDRLRVEIFARAGSYGAWQTGHTIRLAVQFPEPAEVEARVRTVNPVSDAATGVIGVQLEVDNADGRILAGQQCRLAEFAG